MSKKPTEKSPPKKRNPNDVLKYSGMAFQIALILAVAVFIGQKLDEHFAMETPYLTALCTIIALPVALYSTLKDLL
ncbi:MAG: AtpZ/AtpI family protein [Bacteroidota bacterium]